MMPKGVEHKVISRLVHSGQTVGIPMMPKGVEHMKAFLFDFKTMSGNSNDAERR